MSGKYYQITKEIPMKSDLFYQLFNFSMSFLIGFLNGIVNKQTLFNVNNYDFLIRQFILCK